MHYFTVSDRIFFVTYRIQLFVRAICTVQYMNIRVRRTQGSQKLFLKEQETVFLNF
jgi:hypothetical protein